MTREEIQEHIARSLAEALSKPPKPIAPPVRVIVKANEIAGTLEVAWTMPDGVSAEHSVIIERAYRRVERPELMALLDVTLYAERIAIELARVEEVVFARIDVDTEFTCAHQTVRGPNPELAGGEA